ncbi:hypothetical protein I862_01490 [endosymbiont of Acanthamoeba sp. UWC8]|uniref:hypothetical protein n=1 Tax=endosymbiont of Acanthamoeba sp. UWC8 TaxID=86106 RepID=UPI0004D1B23F|nr:hypothetical protein [endosymbiont of Acanthamoeba sp. UWC8]AIF80861.1 hypothetical protein I862_01490 [endosymbiont of Acanthamoeba sp. UWC8]
MQHKWKDIVNSYFTQEVGTSGEENKELNDIKGWMQNRLIKKVGTFAWQSIPLQIISVFIAAISFSKIFGNQGIILFTDEDDESYDKGIQALNNLIFTVSTSLSHSIYQYTHAIDINCRKNKKLYSELKQTFQEIDKYSANEEGDIENQVERPYKLVGDTIAKALEKALTLKGVKNINCLNDFRVTEYTLNMLIAFNKYLLNQGSLGLLAFDNDHCERIAEEFAEIIASTINKRSYVSNLVRAHKPNHAQLKLTPSIENFLIIIDEVMTKDNQVKKPSNESIRAIKQHSEDEDDAKSKGKEKEASKESLRDGSEKGRFEISSYSEAENAEGEISERWSRHAGELSDHKYDASEELSYNIEFSEDEYEEGELSEATAKSRGNEENLPKGSQKIYKNKSKIYDKFLGESKSGSQPINFSLNQGLYNKYLNSGTVAQCIYKIFCSASAGLAIYNPLAFDNNYSVVFRYLLACGSLLTSYVFYNLYTNIRNIETNEREIVERLEDVIRSLYARRLIIKDAESEYLITVQVKQIEEILSETFKALENDHSIKLDEKNQAKVLAITYSALGSVLIEKFNKDQKFEFNAEDKLNISTSLACELAKDISKAPLNSVVAARNPGKSKLLNNIYERPLIDAIKYNLAGENDNRNWCERIEMKNCRHAGK